MLQLEVFACFILLKNVQSLNFIYWVIRNNDSVLGVLWITNGPWCGCWTSISVYNGEMKDRPNQERCEDETTCYLIIFIICSIGAMDNTYAPLITMGWHCRISVKVHRSLPIAIYHSSSSMQEVVSMKHIGPGVLYGGNKINGFPFACEVDQGIAKNIGH